MIEHSYVDFQRRLCIQVHNWMIQIDGGITVWPIFFSATLGYITPIEPPLMAVKICEHLSRLDKFLHGNNILQRLTACNNRIMHHAVRQEWSWNNTRCILATFKPVIGIFTHLTLIQLSIYDLIWNNMLVFPYDYLVMYRNCRIIW